MKNEVKELKEEIQRLEKKLDIKIKTELIKTFSIKPGEVAILCFDTECGLTPRDISNINDPALANTKFFIKNATRTQILHAFGRTLDDITLSDIEKEKIVTLFDKYLDEDFANRT